MEAERKNFDFCYNVNTMGVAAVLVGISLVAEYGWWTPENSFRLDILTIFLSKYRRFFETRFRTRFETRTGHGCWVYWTQVKWIIEEIYHNNDTEFKIMNPSYLRLSRMKYQEQLHTAANPRRQMTKMVFLTGIITINYPKSRGIVEISG